ncbi:hypothetical protein GCM10017608_06130 [Agromyces luteolus]|uniref:NTP transferase domain-containing protein n=1 Tax=Agromyces luteolus TaxID=88373 RepID=UPI0022F2CF3A|nr:NTP transferase domain-containing protein [Agromyces luteolus]GLK26681.1 hypothetical protein GCM10017608_06130 [Agromyces luteolus]
MSRRADAPGWTVVVPVKSLTGAKTRLAPELGPAERAALARAFALDTIDAARAAGGVRRVLVVSDEPVVERELRGVAGVDVVPEFGPRGLAAAIAHGIAVARAAGTPVLLPSLPSTAPAIETSQMQAEARHPGRFDEEARAGGRFEAQPHVETSQMQGADRHSGRFDEEPAGGAPDAVAVLLGDLPAMTSAHLDAALEAAARHPLAFAADAEGTGTALATALAGVPFTAHFGPDSAAHHRAAGFADLVALEPGAIAPGLRRDVDTAGELREAIGLGVRDRTAEVVRALGDRLDLADGVAPRHPLDPSTAPTGAATAPHGADRKAAS